MFIVSFWKIQRYKEGKTIQKGRNERYLFVMHVRPQNSIRCGAARKKAIRLDLVRANTCGCAVNRGIISSPSRAALSSAFWDLIIY